MVGKSMKEGLPKYIKRAKMQKVGLVKRYMGMVDKPAPVIADTA